MFICDKCLKNNYTTQPSYRKSAGTCEICDKFCVCNDIPSSQLEVKSKPHIENHHFVWLVN